jgi:GTPase SAR1 family protein
VGKTSIIITIVSETFPRQVSKTYHPVILSSDLYMLPINTSTVLLDSSSAREDEAAIDGEVDKAHVIILVYDVNNVECIRRLKSHWLPRIAKANDKVSPTPYR